LTTCLHYSDDWEIDDDQNWDDIYKDVWVVFASDSLSNRSGRISVEHLVELVNYVLSLFLVDR
jgi:hypothetical protein